MLASCYMRLNDPENAIAACVEIASQDSVDASVQVTLGYLYQKMGDPDNAELYYSLALERDPDAHHALFGVGAFVLFFNFGTSILAASLTLAVMTLPVVIVATRESLQAVPMAFREACWNMGATRWQTIRRVVLPNAVSGILTGVILEVSRTTGETAPIMFTGAVFFTPFLPQGVFDQTMAMSLHLFVISTQVPGVPDQLPYGVALVLIAMVLVMNSASIALRMYLRGRKKW